MAVRLVGVVVCLALVACKTEPRHERKPDPRVLIQAETPAPEESFTGCDYDPIPMVHLTNKGLFLDGLFLTSSGDSEQELRTILQSKRDLEAELDIPPKRELLLQADDDVARARVRRIKAVVHQMGYFDAQVLPRSAPRKKPQGPASN